MKKIFYFYLTFLNVININAQTNNVINWINSNSIIVEDANPNNELIDFEKKMPQKFINANIYGFGEASHHGKEFFDIKTKFFKYLVEKQGIKVFIMEESFQAENGINEWISGGKGDKLTIANNFSIYPWQCKEVINLLEWMRTYNLNKSKEEQIRFYGIDCQIGKKLNNIIREFIEEQKIIVSEELLTAIDECAKRQFTSKENKSWADSQIPKLDEIEKIILEYQKKQNINSKSEISTALRALNYLKNYTIYLQNPKTEIRDEQMFKNLQWLLNTVEKGSKVFIWAHNEHINKKGNSNSIVNLGNLLKKQYGDKYYSVGFDFGIGTLKGVVFKNGKMVGWENYILEETYKNTFAETLFKANPNIYFIDMEQALNNESTGFFSAENKHVGLGGSGFNPKKPIFMKRNYTDTYDGLIFVKKISTPEYFSK